MRDMVLTDEFVKEFSEHSRMTQKDVRYFLQSLGSFIDLCIDEQVSFKTNVFELYYSEMKSRETKMFGKLPPTRKARARLANKYRNNQKSQSKIYRTVLEKTEAEQTLTEFE
jgi:UDP-2,3-diacylglucosamine pyrophosphatase LpxH